MIPALQISMSRATLELGDAGGTLGHGVEVLELAGQRRGPARDRCASRLGLVQRTPGDQDVGPAKGQDPRGFKADAGGCAGHQSHPAGQVQPGGDLLCR